MFNLWFSQMVGIYKNATVYERLTNRHQGEESPFDLGWLNNFKQFLGMQPFRVNWINVHSLSDVYHV